MAHNNDLLYSAKCGPTTGR